MKVEDFELLVDCCRILLDDNRVRFSPYSIKDNNKVAKIIIENNLDNLSAAEFSEVAGKCMPFYKARKKIKNQKLDKYNSLSPKEVSELPLEEKVSYLELLFPRNQTRTELKNVCSQNEENLRSCLFHLDFPQTFWQKERKQAERYAALVAGSPQIINKIKNWSQTSQEEKKRSCKAIS